jgi:hypothetical protein
LGYFWGGSSKIVSVRIDRIGKKLPKVFRKKDAKTDGIGKNIY